MKNSYDYTKDERYKSYEKFVYTSLLKLGFKLTNVGTMYLKDLILFAYFNNYYEIYITRIVNDYMTSKNINYITYRTFINCIVYSIDNLDQKLFDSNFKNIFNIDYEYLNNSIKNMIILYINKLKCNKIN